MNMKKMWKRFWTMNVHNHEGFTLVELIIVIAILAILSSVAVVGYSSYVKKANAQADKTLVADIKNTLLLAFYAGDLTEGGYIVLSADGAAIGGNEANTQLAAVMNAAYGSNWPTALKLKDTGYVATSTTDYGSSSYKGNEDSLLQEVDKLTEALSNANINLGSEFEEMLNGYGYEKGDGAAVGNVATLYVASKTENQGDLIEKTFKENFKASTMANISAAQTAFGSTWTTLRVQIGDAAALAAIYAYAEGYAQYYDTLGINNTYESGSAVTEFHKAAQFQNVTDAQVAFGQVMLAFKVLYDNFGNASDASKPLDKYVAEDGMGLANLRAYVSMMGTVVDNKGVVEGNLESEDCFTDGTVGKLLNTYAALSELGASTDDGQVAVAIVIVDGEAALHVLPLNME